MSSICYNFGDDFEVCNMFTSPITWSSCKLIEQIRITVVEGHMRLATSLDQKPISFIHTHFPKSCMLYVDLYFSDPLRHNLEDNDLGTETSDFLEMAQTVKFRVVLCLRKAMDADYSDGHWVVAGGWEILGLG